MRVSPRLVVVPPGANCQRQDAQCGVFACANCLRSVSSIIMLGVMLVILPGAVLSTVGSETRLGVGRPVAWTTPPWCASTLVALLGMLTGSALPRSCSELAARRIRHTPLVTSGLHRHEDPVCVVSSSRFAATALGVVVLLISLSLHTTIQSKACATMALIMLEVAINCGRG